MRISVDITKPLKKVVVLEHMEKEEGEGADCCTADEIPMLVYYERLPDFCFWCGRVSHQYMECVHYKSQSKDELAYGPWLKATTMADRRKQNRGKDRWNTEFNQSNTEATGGANTELIPSTASGKQHVQEEQGSGQDPNRVQMNPGNNTVLHKKQKSKGVTEDHLMQEDTKLIELEDSHLEKQEQTNKTMAQREETKAGKNERDMNENIWKRETIKQKQKASSQVGQVELVVKEGEDGPSSKCRPKREVESSSPMH